MRVGVGLVVRRSLRQHALASTVTAASIALACGLVLAVFGIQAQSLAAFTGGAHGFQAVVGARGSQLSLVLNAVFHLETSPGNIPWSLYQGLAANPMVRRAVPYAVGDSYEGFRIVGTTPALFDHLASLADGRAVLASGRLFEPDRPEAVVGSFAARRLGLRDGTRFHPTHGVAEEHGEEHGDELAVVGVLAATNAPADRVIWVPIDRVFRFDGHVLRGAGETFLPGATGPIPDAHKEVSAVMLELAAPQAGFFLDQAINKQGHAATLAWPIDRVVADLFEKVGWMARVLTLVAYLVVAVAAASVLASIVNTMSERRREFAILRAIGAHRRTIFAAVVLEAGAIGAVGAAFGLVVYLVIFWAARLVIRSETGVVLDPFAFHPALVLGPLGIIGLAALAGVVPAIRAYRTDVAEHLAPHS